MRWSWLRAAIIGFMLGPGPASSPAEVSDADLPEPERLLPEGADRHVFRGVGFYVWDEDSRAAAEWGVELRRAAGETAAPADPAHWRALAMTSAASPSIPDSQLEAELAAWIGAPEGVPEASSLGSLLCLLPSLDRTCVIASLATSSNESARRALAEALSAPFEAVGVRGALEHLQADPSPEVRRLARSASAVRVSSPG